MQRAFPGHGRAEPCDKNGRVTSLRAGPEQRRGRCEARPARPAAETSSRSVASIVAGNVFTLFNAVIGVFFILILSLGLIADAAFGFIAILNSYIGIRQELKAKRTLDELAVVVAPKAKVIRDGRLDRAAGRGGRARRRRPGRAR